MQQVAKMLPGGPSAWIGDGDSFSDYPGVGRCPRVAVGTVPTSSLFIKRLT